jgi:hypothetical protein
MIYWNILVCCCFDMLQFDVGLSQLMLMTLDIFYTCLTQGYCWTNVLDFRFPCFHRSFRLDRVNLF